MPTTTMTLAEVIALSFGWLLAIIAIIFHILIWKFTHAWTFLRAWLQKVPLVRESDGSWERYVKGKSDSEYSIDLPKGGFINKTPGSHVLDWKSKIPIYQKYGDYSFTIDPEYSPIIQELIEMGIKVTNYDEYKKLIQLATDKQYQAEFLASIKDEDTKQQAKQRIAELEKLVVKIKPFKTYKLQDLSNKFPNNINTINNEHKIVSLVDRNAKKQKLDVKLIIYAGLGCVIVAFAAIMIAKFVKDPSCPDVVCNCAKAGMELAKTAAQTAASGSESQSASEAARNILTP